MHRGRGCLIRMIKPFSAKILKKQDGGFEVKTYEVGETYNLPYHIAIRMVNQGYAVKVGEFDDGP